MKSSLDHLPESKQRELARVVEILFAEFEERLADGKAERHKNGRILKIILFGSYARGDWVDDPGGGYVSDYDILVVVSHDELADVQLYWTKADDRLTAEVTIHKRISAPVNFIVHSLHDVNKKLQRGRPFFIDIVRDGIALYEAQNHPFGQPQKLSPTETLREAEGHFEEWIESAERFFINAKENAARQWSKEAAFLLHQATERLYHGVLLVRTLYSPKSHKLGFLRSQCEQADERLKEAWPRSARFEQRCFELLRRAYVDARYSPHYKITDEELGWLISRIEVLQGLVRRAAEERLDQLREAAAKDRF
ncbi:MAG: HEPN domain-containing protein [Pseudomonadota bacterium]